MKRFLFCLCFVSISGCLFPISPKEKVVARVDNFLITEEEFNEAYNNSSHDPSTRVLSRQAFLKNMIDQKLILIDAQANGLDKDKEFLKMVENFWQQSLLTMALKQKSKEGVNLDQWVSQLRKNSKIEIYEESIQ